MRKRFYYGGEISGGEIVLADEEYRHLSGSARMRTGDGVVLFNGDGMDYSGVIRGIDKKSARIELGAAAVNLSEPALELTLFQAVPAKTDKLELIVQKLTELG